MTIARAANTGLSRPATASGTVTWALPPRGAAVYPHVAVSRDRDDPDGTEYDVTLGTVSVRQ